jgi:hypothetical protein
MATEPEEQAGENTIPGQTTGKGLTERLSRNGFGMIS